MALSSTLAPGARNVVRDEVCFGRRNHKATLGGREVHVVGLSELVSGKFAIFLTDLDRITKLDPQGTALVTDDNPQHGRRPRHFEILSRRTSPKASDENNYPGQNGVLRPYPCHIYPVAKALRQPRPRFPIADGIGLRIAIDSCRLTSELNQLGKWHRRRRGLIAGERRGYETRWRELAAPAMNRAEQEEQLIEVVRSERQGWLQEGSRTNRNPHICFAAVQVSP